MEIAVTGGSGRLGTVLIKQLLLSGYTVRSLDRAEPTHPPSPPLHPTGAKHLSQVHIDLNDLAALTEAIRGCEAVAHLAAFTGPWGQPPGVVYANNTLTTYNILYAASELGLRYVSIASSVNAIGGLGSHHGNFAYFPIDENHPTFCEDDYSLSKWVGEQIADSYARRYPSMTISSLRFHALPDEPPPLQTNLDTSEAPAARNAWSFTIISEAARACMLALKATYFGHEVFCIAAQRSTSAIPSLTLAKHAYPNVPIRGDLTGHKSFFDCSKAERLLGWRHSAD